MNKKILTIFVFIILIIQIPIILSKEITCDEKILIGNEKYQIFDNIDYSRYGNFTITENGLIETEDGWIYYPPYPNYAPSGMPDFSQKQSNWNRVDGSWYWCGRLAEINLIWYIDSKYSDPNGFPGDGIDTYPMVRDYHAPSEPDPGPYTDDHNSNNVDDRTTLWEEMDSLDDYELVERHYYLGQTPGWFEDVGLSTEYIYGSKPTRTSSFAEFYDMFLSGDYYLTMAIQGWEDGVYTYRHSVTLAGISIEKMRIKVCDPADDRSNKTSSNPTYLHNNASLVSHDQYEIILDSPYPMTGSWSLYSFWGMRDVDWIVQGVWYIRENYPPETAVISGPIVGNISTEYFFTFTSSDNHEDDISFYVDWGDGTNNNWSEHIDSGENYTINHSWIEEGDYIIKVKAKDEYDAESDWTTLEVTMPKAKTLWLFERFPFLQLYFSHYF